MTVFYFTVSHKGSISIFLHQVVSCSIVRFYWFSSMFSNSSWKIFVPSAKNNCRFAKTTFQKNFSDGTADNSTISVLTISGVFCRCSTSPRKSITGLADRSGSRSFPTAMRCIHPCASAYAVTHLAIQFCIMVVSQRLFYIPTTAGITR